MSASNHDSHAQGAHGSLKSYTVGFILCIVLTLMSFGLLMVHSVPHGLILPGIVILAVAQLVVQLVYFLHLGKGERDNTAVFIFTALIIAIVVCGSLWVMHNANVNMMPMVKGT